MEDPWERGLPHSKEGFLNLKTAKGRTSKKGVLGEVEWLDVRCQRSQIPFCSPCVLVLLRVGGIQTFKRALKVPHPLVHDQKSCCPLQLKRMDGTSLLHSQRVVKETSWDNTRSSVLLVPSWNQQASRKPDIGPTDGESVAWLVEGSMLRVGLRFSSKGRPPLRKSQMGEHSLLVFTSS